MARTKLNIQPLRSCGKRRHHSLAEAEAQQRVQIAQNRVQSPSSPTVKVYHCSICDAYHTGRGS